ncbi:hypothetical protein MBLNU13_g10409t1 [Cladosporium sp. NU13]
MAAHVDNASAASDGSPLNNLSHITDTLQDDAAQESRLEVAVSTHGPSLINAEEFSRPKDDLHMDDAVISRLNEKLEAIEELRASKKSLRAELKTANRRLKALRKAHYHSRASYDDAVDPSGSLQDTATPAQIDSKIAILRETSDLDRQTLEAHSSHVRSIQDAIRTTQRALNRSQAEFEAIALQRPPRDEPSRANTDEQTDATNAPPSQHTPASSAQGDQPLLDKYLKRAADVGIFGERLAECSYEYWAAVSQREMRQDRDETLSVSDEDFERYWQTEKEIITRDLDSAIHDADALLTMCQKEGLVAEDEGQDQWDDDFVQADVLGDEHQLDLSPDYVATVTKLPQALFEDAEVVRADPSDDESVLQEKPKIVESVGTWMDGVQAGEVNME